MVRVGVGLCVGVAVTVGLAGNRVGVAVGVKAELKNDSGVGVNVAKSVSDSDW